MSVPGEFARIAPMQRWCFACRAGLPYQTLNSAAAALELPLHESLDALLCSTSQVFDRGTLFRVTCRWLLCL